MEFKKYVIFCIMAVYEIDVKVISYHHGLYKCVMAFGIVNERID